ncbi:hypothetical protein [Achromobacter marplatensis]|uniref:hypothetical protein n=1 Tax=Achromobacter marplatensis TaxID=470868 RepID=UPI0028EB9AD0|nr:hypothetical protein [Achromobacter marplatensis]
MAPRCNGCDPAISSLINVEITMERRERPLRVDSVEKLLPVMLDHVLESASPLARDEIVDLAPI